MRREEALDPFVEVVYVFILVEAVRFTRVRPGETLLRDAAE